MTVPVLHAASRPPAGEGTRPLRIALFSGNYNCVRDGANQALNRLVGYLLDTAGADVRVYSPTVALPAFRPRGELISVPSFPIPGRGEYRAAIGLPRATRRDFDRFAPDLVHLSAPDFLGLAAQRYARARGLPVVASLHTRFETYFDYYGLGWMRPWAERRQKRFYARSDLVLAPTEQTAALLRSQGVRDVGIWSRGVDSAQFSPRFRSDDWRARNGFGPDDMVLLFFGRLVLEKGVAAFADVVDRLRATGRNPRLLIVGDGPARRWFANRLPNARFAGHLSGGLLSIAVASSDILLNTSLTEAFGNVTLEAMASGLPVVGPDLPSVSGLVDHGRTGLLAAAGDVAAYADAVALLLDAPARAAAMGAAAAHEALGHRWDDVLRPVWESYRKLVE